MREHLTGTHQQQNGQINLPASAAGSVNEFQLARQNALSFCPHCTFEAKTRAELRKHIEQGHKEDRGGKCHMCDICGAVFTRMYNLNQHKKVVHQGLNRNFRCPVCLANFNVHENYVAHIAEMHTQQRGGGGGDGPEFIEMKTALSRVAVVYGIPFRPFEVESLEYFFSAGMQQRMITLLQSEVRTLLVLVVLYRP